MSKLKFLVGVSIIFISVVISGCAETVPLEDYDAKVSEYENTITELENQQSIELSEKDSDIDSLNTEIDSLESALSQAQSELLELEDELIVSKQETADAINETISLQSQIDKLKLYSELAYGVWKGPPAGSSDIEFELFYGEVWNIVNAIEDETLSELYYNFMVNIASSAKFNELFNYIFYTILEE